MDHEKDTINPAYHENTTENEKMGKEEATVKRPEEEPTPAAAASTPEAAAAEDAAPKAEQAADTAPVSAAPASVQEPVSETGKNCSENYYYDRYRSDQAKPAQKKKNSGGRMAAAIGLLAVFAVFCIGISWMAFSSLPQQGTEQAAKAEDAREALAEAIGNGAFEEQADAGSMAGQTKDPDTDPAVSGTEEQIQSTGTIRESGQVTAVVTDVTDVVEKVMPACVSITNQFTYRGQDLWGQTFSQDEESSGSGIIIGQNESELLVVTNNHVVEAADALYVQFIDGKVAEAQIKGLDSAVDLAIIAVPLAGIDESTKKVICVAQMGDSDHLKIGEPAIAIGNALGYGQSVTTGVISALNRTLEADEEGASTALIQTDAAINPGNSGGALLNINGEVIGINSNKIGGSVVEGMGYAIPISTAKPIIAELMTRETKSRVAQEDRGYLGISGINVPADLSRNFNLPEGFFVAEVYEGTGAEEAGLIRGDIITAFEGTPIKSQEELARLMQYYEAGEVVEITIMQGSPTGHKPKNIRLRLCRYADMEAAAAKQETMQP